ncbi:MAG: hypothetical protein ACYDD7_06000 [Acidimicrobiales bacterium]
MLASLRPLGERARGNRWGVTVTAYAVGSAAAAAALGAALGLAGALVGLGRGASLVGLAGAASAAGLADLFAARWVPSPRRQVDERWVGRYRGWVYGAGFGLQLGLGFVTVVTTATVYAWMVGAVLTGSASGGALVGAAFGVARALPLAVVATVDGPAALRRRMARVVALSANARVAAGVAAIGVGLAVGVRV